MNFQRNDLIGFLKGALNVDVSDVEDDTLLFSTGVIDSFSMIELITYIESTTGPSIPPGDITLENFDSIGRILSYVNSRAA
ncbi:acyl carrier protein [Defluviimonas sp. WL0050]|uniref:Acyl carrier protein n=1 Tax=Albidovulum litorale TaxID=2984134 RepID=A0ABT2ZTN7_9RHOB|nr:acyl carrier protein [Defluviimonas sp. WL0050]MCV2874521.1 acyl carrier protein [Defluviimonas sp. WL0050]